MRVFFVLSGCFAGETLLVLAYRLIFQRGDFVCARSNGDALVWREMRAFKQMCARSAKNTRASNFSTDTAVLSIRRSFANQIGLIAAQPHGENRVRKTREIFRS